MLLTADAFWQKLPSPPGNVGAFTIAADTGTIALQAGQTYDIKLEYVNNTDFRSLYPSIIRTFRIDPLGLFQPGQDPVAAPFGTMAPHPADGDEPGQAADLPDGGQRVQLVGRGEGRPLHARDRDQRHHRDGDGDQDRHGHLAQRGQCVTHGQIGSLRKMLRGMCRNTIIT